MTCSSALRGAPAGHAPLVEWDHTTLSRWKSGIETRMERLGRRCGFESRPRCLHRGSSMAERRPSLLHPVDYGRGTTNPLGEVRFLGGAPYLGSSVEERGPVKPHVAGSNPALGAISAAWDTPLGLRSLAVTFDS